MVYFSDAAIASGQAFLVSELEKRDRTLNKPLTSVTWPRDIVCKTGGGWVDFTSNYYVDFASAGTNQFGIIGTNTNVIPSVQANTTKDVFPTFNFGQTLRVSFIDQKKMMQVGESYDQMLNEGVKLVWNKMLDQLVYQGLPGTGTYGLVNNPNVTTQYVYKPSGGGSNLWANKTAQQMLNDVDLAIETGWANSNYDPDAIPDQILVDPINFALINRTIVSSAGNISVLTYLENNNIAKAQGKSFKIFPSRWCLGAGNAVTTGGNASQRLVCYKNAERFVNFDITVPMHREATQPVVDQAAYLTLFLGQVGIVKFKYFQPVTYWDGI
jgi:hypothetical protein